MSLGLLWLVDAVLQLQPANLSWSFARNMADSAMAQPAPIQRVDFWTAGIFSAHPLAAGLGVGLIQVTLAAAILWPPTRRVGLLCSIPWAVIVWALGEGFGGLFTGFSMLPSGAPGAALLYSITAIMLLSRSGPTTSQGSTESAAHFGLLGDRGTSMVWGGLWFGAALLQVIPVVTLGFKLSANIHTTSLAEPRWLGSFDQVSARFAGTHGVGLTAVLVVLELSFASVVFVRGIWRTRLLRGALFTLPLLWLAGENFGGLLTGSATDLGAMPLYAVLALGLLPPHGVRPGRDSTRTDSLVALELLDECEAGGYAFGQSVETRLYALAEAPTPRQLKAWALWGKSAHVGPLQSWRPQKPSRRPSPRGRETSVDCSTPESDVPFARTDRVGQRIIQRIK